MAEYVFFCDFDGTITTTDLLDIIIDYSIGIDKRKYMDKLVLDKIIDHNTYMILILKEIDLSFEKSFQLIGTNIVDTHFKKFYDNVTSKGMNIYIISYGFREFITKYIPYIAENHIFSNKLDIINNTWIPIFLDMTKSDIIKKLSSKSEKIIYIGDGISDIDVANDVDILFAKKNSYLEQHCKANKIPFVQFENFQNIIEYFNF